MFPALLRMDADAVMDPRTGEVFTVLDDIEYVEHDSGLPPHCHVAAYRGQPGPVDPTLWMVGHRCLDLFGQAFVYAEVETDEDEDEEVNPFLEPDEPFA